MFNTKTLRQVCLLNLSTVNFSQLLCETIYCERSTIKYNFHILIAFILSSLQADDRPNDAVTTDFHTSD